MVTYSRFGGPDVLELVDAPPPRPDPGQILVSVRAAGVNPTDWRAREGQFRRIRPTRFPAGVGQDAAGVVRAVGPGVRDVEIGDAVFGRGFSTYAEQAVLFAWARLPDRLSFAEAAGYPSVTETALRILGEVAVPAGETLLVSGAAGGVGTAVVQIARHRGIVVVGTASAANQDYLRGLGAYAVTYDPGWVDRVRAIGPVHAALDISGSGVLPDLLALTGDRHRVVTIADLDAPLLGIRFSGVGGDMTAALAETVDLVERGVLTIPVAQSYPLAAAAAAHADSSTGHTRGRRVIVP